MTTKIIAKEVSILSYNTWQLPLIAFTAKKPRHRSVAIAEYFRKNARDIVLLQEVFTKKAYSEISQAFDEIGYHGTKRQKSSLMKKKLFNSGLAIFSKYPIVETKFQSYRNCQGEDCLSNKGMLAVLLEIEPGEYIYVVNTHLQAGDNRKRVFKREKQIDQLEEFLNSDFFVKDIPIILGGDFNTNKGEDDYHYLISRLEVEEMQLTGPLTFSHDSTLNDNLLGKKKKDKKLLDYILIMNNKNYNYLNSFRIIRPKGSYLNYKDVDLSDHFAVEAIVNI